MSAPSPRSSALALALALAPAACATPDPGEDSSDEDGTDTHTGTDGSDGSDGTSETGGEPSCAMPLPLPERPGAPVPWHLAGQLELADEGSTTTLTLTLPADQRYYALRSRPIDGADEDNAQLCHDILEARLVDADRSLIPLDGAPLEPTDQRRFAGPGAGVFAFSSAQAPLLEPGVSDTLELRLQMRNCITGTPASRAFFPDMATTLSVEAAWEPAFLPSPSPAQPARLAARMLVAEDSGWGLSADDPALAAAWAVAVERFAAADVELVLEAEGFTPALGTLDYDATMLSLRALHSEALACLRASADDERFVPIVLVPCLYYDEPGTSSALLGQTTHIPGSFDEGTNPSLVVLAAGACSGTPEPSLDPARHGLILAHEIGHYLGLHHIDSILGEHLAGDPGAELMRSTIYAEPEPADAWFSQAQIQVLQRHPALRQP